MGWRARATPATAQSTEQNNSAKASWRDRAKSIVEEPGLLEKAGSGVKAFFEGPPIGEQVPVLGPLAARAAEGTRALIEGGLSDNESVGDAYDRIHAENEATKAQYEKENPGASLAKKVVGGLGAGMVPIPGAGTAGVLAGGARIAGSAGLSAADQYLRTGSADEAKQAATVAGGVQAGLEAIPVVGKAVAPISKPVMDYLKKAGQGVQDTAAMRAVKHAFGNRERPWTQVGGNATKVGADAIESGAMGFGDTAAKTADKARTVSKEAWGEGVEPIFAKATEAGHEVDGAEIAKEIRAAAETLEKIPGNAGKINAMEKNAQFFEEQGLMPLKRAQELKGNFEWKRVEKLKDELGKNGNNAINEAISKNIKDTVQKSGVEGAEDFVKNYQRAGSMGSFANEAKKTAQTLNKNRSPFSLTDYIAGGATGAAAGAITGDPKEAAKAGLITSVANHLARTRGNSALAVGLFKIGAAMKASPDLLQKYGSILANAAKRGTDSLAVTHFLLMKNDPNYAAASQEGEGP